MQTGNKRSTNMRSTNWLRRLRENAGLDTQDELAVMLQLEGISVTRASVSHWENDRYKPPLSDPHFRQALAKVLRISQPELLRQAGFEVAKTSYSNAAERAAYLVEQMDEETQDKALRILEALL